jgi:hypothetical protein
LSNEGVAIKVTGVKTYPVCATIQVVPVADAVEVTCHRCMLEQISEWRSYN